MNTLDSSCHTGTTNNVCGTKCIRWSAIVVGAFIAIGLSFLLNLFSVAIGLSIYDVDASGVSTLTVGGMVGFAIGIIAVMFTAGWVSGYLGRSHCDVKHCGCVYGFTMWCLALILMILLSAPAASFVNNYTGYLSHTTVTADARPEIATQRQGLATLVRDGERAVSSSNEEAVNDLGKGAFVLFLMFFFGAIAATCGGHAGVHTCCKSKDGVHPYDKNQSVR